MRPIGELVLKWTLMIKWIEKSRIWELLDSRVNFRKRHRNVSFSPESTVFTASCPCWVPRARKATCTWKVQPILNSCTGRTWV
jgi:hypothetical protein